MTNKTALVTGASGGIGKEIAKQLFLLDYNLILVSRKIDKLEQVKESILTLPGKGKVYVFQADLSEKNSAQSIFDYTDQQNFVIDVLVNNAGAGIYGSIDALDKNKIYQVLMLNVYSMTCLCQLYAQAMKQRKSGFILNIASLAAYQPVPYIAAYAASKSYVLNFSEAIAMELEDYGVSVTCFSPGHTATNFYSGADIPDSDKFYAMSTRASAEVVAKAAIDSLFKRKLSVICGLRNTILGLASKFSTRKMAAKISKKLVGGAHVNTKVD